MVIDPLLPYKLAEDFGFTEPEIGVFFFRFTSSAVIFTFLFLLIPDTKVNKLYFVVGGGFFAAAGAFMTGPSRLFGLLNELNLIKAGLIVSGLGKALLKSSAFAYSVKSGQDGFPASNKEEVERKVPLMVLLWVSWVCGSSWNIINQ